jgi:hypothetical protein
MTRELFGGILDSIGDSFRHLGNANPTTVILIAAGIALVGYFLLRTR